MTTIVAISESNNVIATDEEIVAVIAVAVQGPAGTGGGGGGAVTSVAGRGGDVVLTTADLTDFATTQALKISTSTLDTDAALTANSDAKIATQKATKSYADTKIASSAIDTDAALTANSDSRVASQKAIKAYADQLIAAANATVYKGVIDCSANPNYPAADAGWLYRISVSGKIGGASGVVVEAGDMVICLTDGTASGNQATVGANWNAVQANIDGAVVGPASATDTAIVVYNGTTGKLVKNSGVTIDGSGNITANNVTGSNSGDVTLSKTGTGAATMTGQALNIPSARAGQLRIPAPVNDTIEIDYPATEAYTINSLSNLILTSGTLTLTVNINGTPVTGLTNLSVTSVTQTATATSANVVAIGDLVTIVISAVSSAVKLLGKFKRTLS